MSFISPLFFGFLAAVGALVTELFVFSFFIQDSATQTISTASNNFVFATGGLLFLFLAAIIEESFKYALLKKTLSQDSSFSKIVPFLLLFCIGFSGLEITLLLLDNPVADSMTTVHIVEGFLLHLTTIFLFGRILTHPPFKKFSSLFIPVATLLHFFYNVVIFYQDTLHI